MIGNVACGGIKDEYLSEADAVECKQIYCPILMLCAQDVSGCESVLYWSVCWRLDPTNLCLHNSDLSQKAAGKRDAFLYFALNPFTGKCSASALQPRRGPVKGLDSKQRLLCLLLAAHACVRARSLCFSRALHERRWNRLETYGRKSVSLLYEFYPFSLARCEQATETQNCVGRV